MAVFLLVDDMPEIRRLVRRMLEVDHQITEARSGAEALTLLGDLKADLVILDIVMPEMDGIELVRRIRALRPTLPILAMSGGGRARRLDLLDLARKFGADDILAKPFKEADLRAKIDALLVNGVAKG